MYVEPLRLLCSKQLRVERKCITLTCILLLVWFICISINSHVFWRGSSGGDGQWWMQAALAAQAAAVAAEAVHICTACAVWGHVS